MVKERDGLTDPGVNGRTILRRHVENRWRKVINAVTNIRFFIKERTFFE
jgi:hypothetical protein